MKEDRMEQLAEMYADLVSALANASKEDYDELVAWARKIITDVETIENQQKKIITLN